MSDNTDEELEQAEAWARNLRPGSEVRRGRERLRQRQQAAAKKRSITIRLDEDLIERFKTLAGEEGSYQRLINRAAREWLGGQDMEETLRRVMREVLDDRDKKAG